MRLLLHHAKFYTALLAVFFFLLPSIALAEPDAIIENIKLANTRDDLVVYFDVKKAFTEEINEAVLNGIPTTFSFLITLANTDNSWFSDDVSDLEIKSTLKYNPLKKEFSIFRPWKNDKPIITKSFDEAKSLMTNVDNLKTIPLNELIKGNKYQLRIKAELDTVTLPMYLHYVFFFVSLWDFETNWYVINFTY
jgi:hypothetical protein